MKTNPDFENEDALLNAVLGDEGWQATNAVCKAAAVETFRERQRARRVIRWTGFVVALAATLACGVYWLGRSAAGPTQIAAKPPDAPTKTLKSRFLTDAELVASFPNGSCFLAEIDGKKKLVFLDPDVERRYVATVGELDSVSR